MISYLLIGSILAILSTSIINPVLHIEMYNNRKKYKEVLKASKNAGVVISDKPKKEDCFTGHSKLVYVNQTILFICMSLLFSSFLFLSSVAIKWTTVFAYLWMPGIVNFLFGAWIAEHFLSYKLEDKFCSSCVIIFIIFIAISCITGIHKSVYRFMYPLENATVISDTFKNTPLVDETAILEIADVASGSILDKPIYRNDAWIYPVRNDSYTVSSPGYLVVKSNEDISFVKKEIVYSPWQFSTKSCKFILRMSYPSVVFFGDTTMQIDPYTGDVYFCQFYGDYAFYRAGRKIEGAFLINATTGEITDIPFSSSNINNIIEELPEWVDGISF